MKYPKSKRSLRLGAEFQKLISGLLRREVEVQFSDTMITVPEVRVSDDLKHAAIYISIHTSEKNDSGEIQKMIVRMMPKIRKTTAMEIRIRQIPEFRLVWDDTLDRADRIEQLLNRINNSQSPPKGENGESS